MNASERFIAGEGELAALLRTLPAFDPPAGMAERFAMQVQSIQAARLAQSELSFEAPAGMSPAFLRAAADIQAAQMPRREAVMREVAQGKDSEAVLGDEVREATWQWLQRRAALQTEAPALRQPAATKKTWSWWP